MHALRKTIALVLTTGASLLATHSLRAGIVAHYTFDESSGTTVHDSAGSVNGTFHGNPTFVAGGISGNALSLTTSGSAGDYVDFGANFGTLPTSAFSMEAWVKTTSASSAFPLSKHNGGTQNGFLLGVNDINPNGGGLGAAGKATAYVSSGNNPATPISSITVNDGSWHQLLATYTPGGSLTLYVDGVLQSSTNAQTYNTNTSDFIVGGIGQNSSDGTPVNLYNGLIDDVQLYNNALSTSDATFLFQHPGQVVPEPMTLGIAGLLGVAAIRRRRAN